MKLFYSLNEAQLAARYRHCFELEALPFESAEPGARVLVPHEPAGALVAIAGRLQLGAGTGLVPQFVAVDEVLRRVSLRSDLARACGLNKRRDLTILDACAGWGIDGLALAAAGARVTLLERQPAVWALLDDLLQQRAWGEVNCQLGDARQWLQAATEPCDVVYLDPMFPVRNKTALPNQRLQLLARLAATEAPAALEDWLPWALQCARRRVVLKRRRKDPVLQRPDWQISGKTVRYDVYAAS